MKTTYGYKAHVDEDGFVKTMEMTQGNVHDSQVFTELLSGEEATVYADSAYASGKTDEWLAEKNGYPYLVTGPRLSLPQFNHLGQC